MNTYVPFFAKPTGSGLATVYTCPSGTTAVINNITVSNVAGLGIEAVDIIVTVSSVDYYIAKGVTIPTATTLQISGPIVLSAGATLRVGTTYLNSVHVVGSVMETT